MPRPRMADKYPVRPKVDDGLKQHPFEFFEALKRHLEADTDVQLAQALNILPAQLSKLRSGKQIVTYESLLIFYDETGLSIEELRTLLYRQPFTAPLVPVVAASERFFKERKKYTIINRQDHNRKPRKKRETSTWRSVLKS